jgi:anti-sigma factor ChrR (cupin superfamily)
VSRDEGLGGLAGHGEGCPSGLDLALLAAGELDEARGAAIGAHATPCRRCADRLHEIEEARAELFGRDPDAIAAAARFIAAELDERADEPAIDQDAHFGDRFDH